MARIVIYDSTELDRQQISDGLKNTDHDCVYIESKIALDNLDPEAEVIAVFVTSEVSKDMIAAMPKLKLIACRSTGFNTVDVAAANQHGVTVVNVPTYGESTVAEYAFTLLLALVRKIPEVLDDGDHDQSQLRGADLYGKTMGVVGTGHIGQRAIAIAKGFGMRVVAFDPFPNEDKANELGYSYKSFDEVLAVCDFLTLHAPYTDQTHHMINADSLKKMKKSAVLINTARGELVDSKALLVALSDGMIAGAGLDVVEGEAVASTSEEIALLRGNQIPPELLMHSMEISSLEKMPNVMITPHNAFNTVGAIGRINSTTAANIIDFWYGRVPNKVKPPKKTMGKLIMVRHTESEWNASGKWTGTRDVHLSEKGFREAAKLGHELRGIGAKLDVAFCSEQVRTLETLESLLNASAQIELPIKRSRALNERDYGDYTGMNKWEVKEQVGEKHWNDIRRGWDVQVPNGETLKRVYDRTTPYFKSEILPLLKEGKNVLLVAHGNSLRALIKYIESIPDQGVAELEMLFGDIVQYALNGDGKIVSKDVKHVDFTKLHEAYEANLREVSGADPQQT